MSMQSERPVCLANKFSILSGVQIPRYAAAISNAEGQNIALLDEPNGYYHGRHSGCKGQGSLQWLVGWLKTPAWG